MENFQKNGLSREPFSIAGANGSLVFSGFRLLDLLLNKGVWFAWDDRWGENLENLTIFNMIKHINSLKLLSLQFVVQWSFYIIWSAIYWLYEF